MEFGYNLSVKNSYFETCQLHTARTMSWSASPEVLFYDVDVQLYK